MARLQSSRWAEISTMWDPIKAGGNETDQQVDGRTPSGISQECTGPKLQGVEAIGKLYREKTSGS